MEFASNQLDKDKSLKLIIATIKIRGEKSIKLLDGNSSLKLITVRPAVTRVYNLRKKGENKT